MANPLHFRSYFKFLGRNKLYTTINVFGLSVSLMFVIFVGLHVRKETSVDDRQSNKDRIYVLGYEEELGSTYGIQPYLTERYPEIETMCGTNLDEHVQVTVNGEKKYADILYADSTFFDVFSFRISEGDRKALSQPSSAIISESFARKMFGNENPVGTAINVDNKYTVSVAAVMEDIWNSCLPYADIMTGIPNLLKAEPWMTPLNSVGGGFSQFILVREGADIMAKTDDMLGYFNTFFWMYQRGWAKEVVLTPLKDVYFSGIESDGLRQGNRPLLNILIAVALIVLIFAVLNYINLTVAQTGFRAKEMATRGLLGASPREIFLKFIFESIAMCATAFIIGLLLAGAFQNTLNNMLQSQLDVWAEFSWGAAGMSLLFVVLLGAIAGTIPAVHIVRYRAIDVVRGTFRQRSKMIFGKVFITFQNIITITLMACSLTVMLQIRHMMGMPLGYNTENIMYISVREARADGMERIGHFRNEVENLASVKRVSGSNGHPFQGGNNHTMEYNGKYVSFQMFIADSMFFDILGLEIIKDNQPATSDGYWITKRVLYELDLPEDAENFTFYDTSPPIMGVVKEFNLRGAMYDEVHPILINIQPRTTNFWGMLVEVRGDRAATYNEIKELYETMFERELDADYLDDIVYNAYLEQRQAYRLISLFTAIAVIISMLGLLAMSTYYIQQRAGEIAVRKVFGSTRKEIFNKLVRNFLKLVLIAFVVAVPVIWYFMSGWLSGFPYRIGLSPRIFLAAGAMVFILAAITVTWQSYLAANKNPMESIHKE